MWAAIRSAGVVILGRVLAVSSCEEFGRWSTLYTPQSIIFRYFVECFRGQFCFQTSLCWSFRVCHRALTKRDRKDFASALVGHFMTFRKRCDVGSFSSTRTSACLLLDLRSSQSGIQLHSCNYQEFIIETCSGLKFNKKQMRDSDQFQDIHAIGMMGSWRMPVRELKYVRPDYIVSLQNSFKLVCARLHDTIWYPHFTWP